jgi:hypothetical protein
MFCAISGQAAEKAVVSKITGHVYEASLLEKYLTAEGKVRSVRERGGGSVREDAQRSAPCAAACPCPLRAVGCGPPLARCERSARGAWLNLRACVCCVMRRSVRSLARR